MAECRRVRRMLQAYLDGELARTTAQQAVQHLEACQRCNLEAQLYREIKRALARQCADDVTVHRLQTFARRVPHSADRP